MSDNIKFIYRISISLDLQVLKIKYCILYYEFQIICMKQSDLFVRTKSIHFKKL